MICIEERHERLYFWREEGGRDPVDPAHLEPVVIERMRVLKSRRVGERIDGCGARLMTNVFVIHEDQDSPMG